MSTQIPQVNHHSSLENLHGVVKMVFPRRKIYGDDDEDMEDDGPLSSSNTGNIVVSCNICELTSSKILDDRIKHGPRDINIFFYGLWADKVSSLLKKDSLVTISGPSTIVHKSLEPEIDDHPFCICVDAVRNDTDQAQSLVSVKITTRSGSTISLDSNSLQSANSHQDHQEGQQEEQHKSMAPKQKRQRKRPVRNDYRYFPLDARTLLGQMNRKINVYGVVMSYTAPKSCYGTHNYKCTYNLVDPVSGFENPVSLNVFCQDLESFPSVLRVGDVLRAHRVKVQAPFACQTIAVGAHFDRKHQIAGVLAVFKILHFYVEPYSIAKHQLRRSLSVRHLLAVSNQACYAGHALNFHALCFVD